ncbi:hypothetical protein BH20ACT14_BH20ACT14_10230 [soil metagenome]
MDDGLAGVYAHPDMKRRAVELEPCRELLDRSYHGKRAAHAALRVLFTGIWYPENRDGSVAEELLERSAVASYGVSNRVEVGLLNDCDILRVELFGERCESREIAEEDGDDPPFEFPLDCFDGHPMGLRGRAARASSGPAATWGAP